MCPNAASQMLAVSSLLPIPYPLVNQFMMSILRLPRELLETVCDYIGDPVSYSRLRASCRTGHALLSPELSVSLDALELLDRRYSVYRDSSVYSRFRITDGLSQWSVIKISRQSCDHVERFMEKFSADEIRGNLSKLAIQQCLEDCSFRQLVPACAKLLDALDDAKYVDRVCLYRELENGSFDIVDLMVEKGACLRQNRARGSLLQMLCEVPWSIDGFKFLLSRGVPVNEVDLLHFLVTFNSDCDPEMLDIVLRGHKDRELVQSSTTFTQRACALVAPLALLKVLLKHGAPMDANDCVGFAGDYATIRFLVRTKNADVNFVNTNGSSAMSNIVNDPNTVSKFGAMLGLGAKMTPQLCHEALQAALETPNPVSTIKALIKAGININARDDRTGRSVLDLAIADIQCLGERVVEFLIKSGMNLDLQNRQGVTAMMIAASCCSPKIVSLLISNGANVEGMDEQGRDALEHSVEGGNHPVERLLRYYAIQQSNLEPKRRRRGQYSPN